PGDGVDHDRCLRGPASADVALHARHDNPELLIANVRIERASEILDELAARVVAGERFDPADAATCDDDLVVTLRDVHPVHVERGLVGAAQTYYDWSGWSLPEIEALRVRQVVLPPSEFCRCHAGGQPRLHLPH